MKVMIADDNRLMLEGFRRALERVEDIEIVGVTHSGAEVLSLVERRRPEVVALDLGTADAGRRAAASMLFASSYPDDQGRRAVRDGDAGDHPLGAEPPARGRSSRRTSTRWTSRPRSGRPTRAPSTTSLGSAAGPEDALREAGLTEREITMLKALARGLSNKAISQELWVTEQTVKFHLGNLYRKLGVPNRLAAASYAHSHGVG